jgi:outer membrane receptor for ferrienterochelin and colicin
MPNNKRCSPVSIATVFILLVWCSSLAQNDQRILLSKALETLETNFDVRFSYAGAEIGMYSVHFELLPTLQANLDRLGDQVPLSFNQIDERYITIVTNAAQFLCGKLFSATSGLPLENATLTGDNGAISTTTGVDGIFYVPISIPGTTKLNISYIGHESLQIAVSELSSECRPILLQEVASQLETVVVKNFLTSGIELNNDGSIAINTRNFGLLPGQVENDVLLIAQALPGVKSPNETISNISIRGGTYDEVLILWDDIRMFQSGHFFGLISAFNPDITKEVKLIKNGTPARYGEGVSGVITMRSENEVAKTFSGGAGFNLINGSAFGIIPLANNASIQVSGRRTINNLIETPVYKSYSEKVFQDTEITNADTSSANLNITTQEDFSFYDFSLKLLWDFTEKDAIRIHFLTIDNSLDFDEGISGSLVSKRSLLEQQSIVGGISWRRDWYEKFSTKTLIYGSFYNLDGLNRDVLTTQEIFQENTVLETGLKQDASYTLSPQLTFQGGYQFTETGIGNTQDVNLPRFRDYTKDVLRTHSAYAGINFRSKEEKTIVDAAVRANYFSKFDELLLEPRVSFQQDLGSGFELFALGEFKSQTTTQRIDFDSDFLGVEKRRWVIANNDDIPIIKSKQGSLGINFSERSWLINLEGFYKKVNGITASNQGFQNQFQFERSTGSYNAKGAELVVNKRKNNYSLWLSYAYLESEYAFDNFIPGVFPHNLDVTHAATLAGSYKLESFKFALGLNWRSGKPYTSPLGVEVVMDSPLEGMILYDLPNAERLPDYFRADISAEYLWGISDGLDAKINLAVLNMLDTRNTLNTRYALIDQSTGSGDLKQIDAFSIGITPNFSLQLLF